MTITYRYLVSNNVLLNQLINELFSNSFSTTVLILVQGLVTLLHALYGSLLSTASLLNAIAVIIFNFIEKIAISLRLL